MVSEKRPKMSESRLILPVDAGHEEGAFQGCDPFLEQFPDYGFLVMGRQRPEAPRHLLQVRSVDGGLRLEVRSQLLQGAPGRVQDRKSTRRTPVTNAHLVCRLLLEKKKPPCTNTRITHPKINLTTRYTTHSHATQTM